MCKSRSATMASQPKSRPNPRSPISSPVAAVSASSAGVRTDKASRPRRHPPTSPSSSSGYASTSKPSYSASASASASATSSSSSALSLASLRGSLPEPPILYPFAELGAATNNFLAKRLPAASSGWRCTLRGRDAVVIQRPLRRRRLNDLPARLAALGRSHHSSLVRLLGACPSGDHIYLVYEYVPGASLSDCLRNQRNPSFTPLASWVSRVQVATDVAQGLEYIHKHSSVTAGVHDRLKSSSIIVTEPDFRAKICHFGAADLTGEIPDTAAGEMDRTTSIPSPQRREGTAHVEGTRGYMAPELLGDGSISRQSDVFAFGVVLLEILSGDEPLKYRYDKERKDFEVTSLIDSARKAIGGEGVEGERQVRVRRWVDRRLKDSFPVEAAEKLIRVALRCVDMEPDRRPDMTWAAGKVSKVYLESKVWAERIRVPTDFSVSMAPR